MIRKTLGWSDAHGRPLEEEHRFTWNHLIQHAGIARGSVSKAIREALRGKFIEQKEIAKPKTHGNRFQSSVFTLRWHESPEYVKDPEAFRGFFSGEGNRTYIPNQFFDVVLRSEPLGIIKVVGSVIRFSIGFQNRYGFRRQQVQQSIDAMARYTRSKSRDKLHASVVSAVQLGYIVQLDAGHFDPKAGQGSRAAVYALNWNTALDPFKKGNGRELIGSKKGTADRFKKEDEIGSEMGTADRFKKGNDLNNNSNNTSKQQLTLAAEEISHEEGTTVNALTRAGFDGETASFLVEKYPKHVIKRQLNWIERRNPNRNRLGMLRKAIQEDWGQPQQKLGGAFHDHRRFISGFYAGLAGNSGQPVAMPSRAEMDASEAIVRQLVKLNSGSNYEAKGRDFGIYVRKHTGQDVIHSFSSALRIHGDRWLCQEESERRLGRASKLLQSSVPEKAMPISETERRLNQIRADLEAKAVIPRATK